MTDLVTRLRAAAYDDRLSTGALYSLAADEIERLRADAEPVAWRVRLGASEGSMTHVYSESRRSLAYMQAPLEPLYAHPSHQRQPLTEAEIYAAIKGIDSLRAVEVARAVERAHGITGETP